MIKVDVQINTNGFEKEKMQVPMEAIYELTGEGFATNKFEGKVTFICFPRALPPDFMEVIIQLKDIGEMAIVYGTIIRVIWNFFKKTRGYQKSIRIETEKTTINIPVKEDDKFTDIEIRIKEQEVELKISKENKAS